MPESLWVGVLLGSVGMIASSLLGWGALSIISLCSRVTALETALKAQALADKDWHDTIKTRFDKLEGKLEEVVKVLLKDREGMLVRLQALEERARP